MKQNAYAYVYIVQSMKARHWGHAMVQVASCQPVNMEACVQF
jgi:hypothetical protein